VRARDLAREQNVKKDIIREPVELIDEDLDVIAGRQGVDIDVNVNIAVIDQLIQQITILSSDVASSASASASVTQTS
jgi:S-adenosylmethionine synthetase